MIQVSPLKLPYIITRGSSLNPGELELSAEEDLARIKLRSGAKLITIYLDRVQMIQVASKLLEISLNETND